MMTREEKLKALENILEAEKKISKKTGEFLQIGLLEDFETARRDNYLLTGVIGLDANIGGIKKGTINILYGLEGTGKSTLALETLASFQMTHPDDFVLYIDTEQSVDDAYLDRFPGINKKNIVFIKDTRLEIILDKTIDFCKQGLISFIIIDSMDHMVALSEDKKSLEDNVMMDKAKVLPRAIAKFGPVISNFKIPVIMVQQVRTNFKGMIAITNGRSGGNTLKHAPATITFLSKINSQNENGQDELLKEKVVNQYCKIKNVKSKTSEPYRETHTYINADRKKKSGVAKIRELFDYAVMVGLLKQSGAWIEFTDYTTGEIKKINGTKKMMVELTKNMDLYTLLKLYTYGRILPPEILIAKFDELKLLLERENHALKKAKVDLLIVSGLSKGIKEIDKTDISLKDKKILDLISQDRYDYGKYILMNDEEREAFVKEKGGPILDPSKIELIEKVNEEEE